MKVLVFGGTTEGRILSARLSGAGHDLTLSVATEYAKEALIEKMVHSCNRDFAQKFDQCFPKKQMQCVGKVLTERLDEKEIAGLLKHGGFDCVVDATHPYAVLATKNIYTACTAAGIKYYRLKRPECAAVSGVTYTPDAAKAAEILGRSEKKALLAIGSKDLGQFVHIKNYAERFFVRILPMEDSLKKAYDLGFRGPNIICMQGPFSKEMNIATLKMTGAEYLVTKESGDAGGFGEKVSAALSLGCEVIVIGRPIPEEGYTLDELVKIFGIEDREQEALEASDCFTLGVPQKSKIKDSQTVSCGDVSCDAPGQKAFFPLFVDMSGKKALVVGGGNIAERRIKTLAAFGADLTVISPETTEYIENADAAGKLRLLRRKYQNGDIAGHKSFLVVTAANDRKANHEAGEEAAALGIPVSVADCRRECSFCFPAIAENKNIITGIVSKNGDHAEVKRTAEKIRKTLDTGYMRAEKNAAENKASDIGEI